MFETLFTRYQSMKEHHNSVSPKDPKTMPTGLRGVTCYMYYRNAKVPETALPSITSLLDSGCLGKIIKKILV